MESANCSRFYEASRNDLKKLADFLEIEEDIENVIVEENSEVTFECKVNGHPLPSCEWFKNGKPITNSQRTRIRNTSNKNWYLLEIKQVCRADHGVYTIVCRNKCKEISSKAYLFVANRQLNDGVFYTETLCQGLAVTKHLRNVKVVQGERIQLEAHFLIEGNDDVFFLWLKNNDAVHHNTRTIFLSSNSHSVLSILNARLTDTGVYHVIVKSAKGIVSSFADVQVTSVKEFTRNDELLPIIIQDWLPDDIKTYEHEETRMICKVSFDINTSVQWHKNGVVISQSNFIMEDYGGQYIGLRGVNVTRADKGEYTVILRDEETKREDTCSTTLTVIPAPTTPPTRVALKRALVSAVACCGSKVTFDCSFALEDPKYFYVVWHVGHYRVERTNTQFSVVHSGGEYLLYIKKVEPGMSGQVMCELRKALPNQTSIRVNRTTATLAIVPSVVLEQEEKQHPLLKRGKLYNEMNPCDDKIEIVEGVRPSSPDALAGGSTSQNGHAVDTDVIIEMTYCRLDNGLFFFQACSKHSETISNRLVVYEKSPEGSMDQALGVVIKWDGPPAPGAHWFGIELGQENGTFLHVGVTSQPNLELLDPPEEKMMRLRVKLTDRGCHGSEASVSIANTPSPSPLQPLKHELRPLQEFEDNYFDTGDQIGHGSFGNVILVRDATGDLFAAKVQKTRTQKKRDMAQREFDTMKLLRHPKLVELRNAYVGTDSYIFVMEYFWGGELFDRIIQEDHIQEVDVVPYVRQICEGLAYLHRLHIAHLDLKPENIVCLSPNSGQVKIVDFGLARVIVDGNITRALYGTRDYAAPEVLNFDRLTTACDMWSLGVLTYMLLAGIMPFAGDSWLERSFNISIAKYTFDESAFREVSDMARDFVEKLLLLNAKERMTAREALHHPWVREGPPKGAKAGHMKRARDNLKSYLADYRARWQRAARLMIVANRLRTHAGARALSEGSAAPTAAPAAAFAAPSTSTAAPAATPAAQRASHAP